MRVTVASVVIVCALWLPTIARADGIEITQRLVDDDGWPSLVANYTPDGSRATASWRICAPGCGPVVATGAPYHPGPTAAGTIFEASATVDGATTTARSPAWGGRVTSTAPPTFDGEPRVGQILTPRPGTWAGGWEDDRSLLGMRACPTATGEGCRALTDVRLTGQVTIDRPYAGWYVGPYEQRIGSGTIFPAIAIVFARGRISPHPAPPPGQTIAVGELRGPIPPAPVAGKPRLAFTPVVMVRKRAARRGRALALASVRCAGRCVARVTLRHGRKAVTRRVVVTAAGGKADVRLWPGTFPRRSTVLRVSVRFDNHPATARGSVKLR